MGRMMPGTAVVRERAHLSVDPGRDATTTVGVSGDRRGDSAPGNPFPRTHLNMSDVRQSPMANLAIRAAAARFVNRGDNSVRLVVPVEATRPAIG